MKRTYDLRVCTLFMCVKSNEASRRNYRLLERRKREMCAKAEFAFTPSLWNFDYNKWS